MRARRTSIIVLTGLLAALVGIGVAGARSFADEVGPVGSTPTAAPTESGSSGCPCDCPDEILPTTSATLGYALAARPAALVRTRQVQYTFWVRINAQGKATLDPVNDVAANPVELRNEINSIEVGDDPAGCYYMTFESRHATSCTKGDLIGAQGGQRIQQRPSKTDEDFLGSYTIFKYTFAPKPTGNAGRLFLIDIVCTVVVG